MNNEDTLEDMFSDFLKIYKCINRPKLIEILATELNDTTKLGIYQLSNGENTARYIGDKVKISHTTVTRYWNQWALKGIAIPAKRKGRYMAAFDLREYGLLVFEDDEE